MLGLGIGFSTLAVRNRSIIPVAKWDFGAGILPASASFSRSSTATYFDVSGVMQTAEVDQPRFDHDPSTGAAQGLLVEAASTNLVGAFLHPSHTGNTYKAGDPAATRVIVDDSAALAAAGLAEGGTTVYKLDNSAGSGSAQMGINPTFDTTASDISMSLYARGTGQWAIRTGFTLHNDQPVLSADYLRYNEQASAKISGSFNVNDEMWIEAIAGSTVYILALQAEVAPAPSSYIATSGAPATRAADVLSSVGLNGVFDIRITYGNGSNETFLSQAVADGWQPSLSRNHVKTVAFYTEGALA